MSYFTVKNILSKIRLLFKRNKWETVYRGSCKTHIGSVFGGYMGKTDAATYIQVERSKDKYQSFMVASCGTKQTLDVSVLAANSPEAAEVCKKENIPIR